MTELDFEERYNKLRESHGLPEYSAICNEFDLHNIDEFSPVLPALLYNVRDRLKSFEKMIEEILQPDTTPSSLNESNLFSDDEKSNLFIFYSEIMTLDRDILENNIERDTDKMATTLKKSWESWPSIKERMLAVVRKMKSSWNGNNKQESKLEYFG